MKLITISSLGVAIVLGLCACGSPPSESLKAVGGGSELIFVLAEGAGSKKEIIVENPPGGPNIPAGLGGQLVEPNEAVFKVVRASVEPCEIPGEVLQRGTSCRIAIETTGARAATGTYVLEYGTRLRDKLARITFPIKSQTEAE